MGSQTPKLTPLPLPSTDVAQSNCPPERSMPRRSPGSVHASNGPNEKNEYLIENGNLHCRPICPAISKTAPTYCSISPVPSIVKQECPGKMVISSPDTEKIVPKYYIPLWRLLALNAIADVSVTTVDVRDSVLRADVSEGG